MTGMVSAAADGLVLGSTQALATAATALGAFVARASCTSVLVNLGRVTRSASIFALPLLVEAVCLITFGLLGALMTQVDVVALVAGLLCFTMGLQNALITKVSRSEIRTTHVTGIVTDIGVELGRLLFGQADVSKLRLLGGLLASFAIGGLLGAGAFKAIGYGATLPLAAVLGFLGSVLAFDDLRS